MSFDFKIIKNYWLWITSGLFVVLILSLSSAIIGIFISIFLSILRKKNIFFEKLIKTYIDLIRGTPVYVQLYFFYFGLPSFFKFLSMNKWFSCISVFSINSSAYLCEIIRGGLESINKNQFDSANALGLSKKDILIKVIFPQVLKNIFPAAMNEFITLTKETSIVSIIGINDMMYKFQIVKNQTYSSFEPLLIVFISYYILNKLLSYLGKIFEQKIKY
ncbi:MAG: amino acid ABC transporter permease [Clostridiales bacterium]|jgi:polar amino acid transport system permease protein|nr:amino acid ABC transporter permease [Clostridiales bacterium]